MRRNITLNEEIIKYIHHIIRRDYKVSVKTPYAIYLIIKGYEKMKRKY